MTEKDYKERIFFMLKRIHSVKALKRIYNITIKYYKKAD